MRSGAAWVVWTPPLGRADVPAPGVRPNTDWASVSPFCAARGHRRARVYCFWVLLGTKTRISRRQSRIGGKQRSRCVRPTWAVRLCDRQPDRRTRFFVDRRPMHCPEYFEYFELEN